MPEAIAIELTSSEGDVLKVILAGALSQMKEICTLKEAEHPGVQATFFVLEKVIQQLPGDGNA